MRNITKKAGWILLTIVSVILFATLLLAALPFVGIGYLLVLVFDSLFDWLKEINPFSTKEAPK
ncbi:MAG: hypothetical protein IJQ32_03355 [Paludibacteraceae bacterium]|nr:hypothetical protein [Paludibacteraceae bacterium]